MQLVDAAKQVPLGFQKIAKLARLSSVHDEVQIGIVTPEQGPSLVAGTQPKRHASDQT